MIETSTNTFNGRQSKPIQIKLLHPKLQHLSFTYSSLLPFQLVKKELARDNMLSLFNNYHFQCQGIGLYIQRDYDRLISSHPKDCYEFDVIFEHYKYASALHHFKMVSQLLSKPNHFYSILRSTLKEDSKIQVDTDLLTTELVPQLFRSYKWDTSEAIIPNYKGQLHQASIEKQEFIHFLEYSGFNPPPIQAQFAGDLFYLHLKTLQNSDIHITATAKGFYVNQSKINVYNPTIQNGKHTYASLLDLISSASQKFATALGKISEPNPHSLLQRLWRKNAKLTSTSSYETNKWLDSIDSEHHWNVRKEPAIKDIATPTDGFRDWNSEFVELSRIQEKLSVKPEAQKWIYHAYKQLYNEFTASACEAARGIVEGKVKAINYMDEDKRHIFIVDKIFMSVTTETPYNHKLLRQEEALPSTPSVNTDIGNLQMISSLKPKGLRLLQTLLISFRGWRLLVQTIIPGLLTLELNSITLYGALEDTKSIQADQRFRNLLLPICKSLHLDENVQAVDKSEVVVNIAVSSEIKGIRSTNGQYFLCDIQRFSPRDLNYMGLQNQGCVLRGKIINQYVEDNHIDFNITPPINTNIETETKFIPGPRHQEQVAFLQNIAQYLKETAVPKLINILKSNNPGDFLTDSSGISSIFHEHGINMRYLGFVESHQKLKDNIQVRICLTRVILVRSLKHLFRAVLRSAGNQHVANALSYVLNCIFSKKSILNQLSMVQDIIEEKMEVSQPKKKKKKKNREQQKQVKTSSNEENRFIKSQNCQYLTMKPQQIWTQICKIALARFNHTFEKSIIQFNQKGLFRLAYQKYATLRDVCLCLGLVLQRKSYPLGEADNTQGLPFSPKNILYFTPLSKTVKLNPSSKVMLLKNDADKQSARNEFKQAQSSYQALLEMIRQRKEGEELLNYCLGQISRIQYMTGNLRQAISVQAENLVYALRTKREDCLEVIRSYSRLGLYCMQVGAKQISLWLFYKGLNLMLMSFGQTYPDVLISFANIARIYQQNRQTSLATICYQKAIEILSQVYGSKNHVNISFCYSSLASLYYEIKQYKKSADYQTEAASILSKILQPQDNRLIDALKIQKMYRDLCKQSLGRSSENTTSRDRKK